MNRQEFLGKVSKLKGKIIEQAGKLMDDESLQTEGKVQYLSGVLNEYYGMKKEKIYKTINGFLQSLSRLKVRDPNPVEIKF